MLTNPNPKKYKIHSQIVDDVLISVEQQETNLDEEKDKDGKKCLFSFSSRKEKTGVPEENNLQTLLMQRL